MIEFQLKVSPDVGMSENGTPLNPPVNHNYISILDLQ